jgi:TolA-binding protein
MKKITNEQIMKKLDSIQKNISNMQKDISNIQNDTSNNEMIEKINMTITTVNNIQKTIADKETMRELSNANKKSIVMSYAGLSIAYLGIGLTVYLASIKLTNILYGVIFALFFTGSIVLAYLAYSKNIELKRRI